jgi:hypothetical protein
MRSSRTCDSGPEVWASGGHSTFAGFVVLTVWVLIAAPGRADSISLTGSLDTNNANDVLLYSFSLSAASTLTLQSFGYGGTGNAPGGTNAAGSVVRAGGFDSYISLFDGTGATATFLASNDDGLCPLGNAAPACHDSTLVMAGLAAGSYTIALSVFDNFSFAENFGSGTLGDGFIGLGDYFDAASGMTRTSNYAVDISAAGLVTATPVPEPGLLSMTILGCLALVWTSRHGSRFFARRSR